MFKPDFDQYREITQQGYIVPVYKEYLLDMDSAVSVLSVLLKMKKSFCWKVLKAARNAADFRSWG